MPGLYELLCGWSFPPWLAAVIAIAVACGIVVNLILFVAGFSTYIERKLAADIQRRVGPNQCNVDAFFGEFARAIVRNGAKPTDSFIARMMLLGAQRALPVLAYADRILSRLAPGVLIFMADGIKLFMKEDIIPAATDKVFFKIAPLLVLASAFGALAVLPFSDALYVADYNIGIFYIAAVTSIEVLGILMAGWASNNKWALLGGMRSAAQIVSYEVPVGLVIVTGMLISGTMSMQGLIHTQVELSAQSTWASDGWFWQWNVFHPAMFVLAPVYFLAALAECNRTPFDIPEAESELVAGYHVEYSGMRFSLFFMAEYAMMFVVSAIAVTLFLGGWSTGIGPLEWLLTAGFDPQTGVPVYHWYGTLIHLGAFLVKTYALIVLMMWIRWTLPRFRVDQMMALCWQKLIPLGLLCFIAVGAWMILRLPIADRIGAATLDRLTFWGRAFFAFAVTAWLVWYFRQPLTPEQEARREGLAQAEAQAGAIS